MSLTDDDFKTIEELGDKWPYDWVSVRGLAPYVKRHGQNLTGIEIGTCRGESAYYLLEKCPNVSKLITVDPYKAYQDWNGEITQDVLDKFMTVAKTNLDKYGDRVIMLRETSEEATKNFTDTEVDFVFIDGDHSYEQTLADLEAYYPFVKKGGIVAGHDYGSVEGVTKAVTEFRKKQGINATLNLTMNSLFFWYK